MGRAARSPEDVKDWRGNTEEGCRSPAEYRPGCRAVGLLVGGQVGGEPGEDFVIAQNLAVSVKHPPRLGAWAHRCFSIRYSLGTADGPDVVPGARSARLGRRFRVVPQTALLRRSCHVTLRDIPWSA